MYSLWEEKVGTKNQKKRKWKKLEGDRIIEYESNNIKIMLWVVQAL